MSDEIDFGTISQEEEEKSLSPDDFKGGNFLKNPEPGAEIVFVVQKVIQNKNTKGRSNEGVEFDVGLKHKDGSIKRYDIYTDQGTFTVGVWEVFMKLFGPKGIMKDYAKTHGNSFAGAKIKIKHLMNGNHATTKPSDLQLLMKMSAEDCAKYQTDVKLAKKEYRLYEVSLV